MRILVVGSGGREHALAWKLASSPVVSHVFVAPGNGGTATEPHCENVPIPADDVERLVAFARTEGIQLAVIGPEKPLVLGLADALTEAGIPAFGPSAEVARLEGSKAYAKELMSACGVKTAAYATFEELEPAPSSPSHCMSRATASMVQRMRSGQEAIAEASQPGPGSSSSSRSASNHTSTGRFPTFTDPDFSGFCAWQAAAKASRPMLTSGSAHPPARGSSRSDTLIASAS